MKMEIRAAAFTGHRNILPEHRDELTALLARAIEYLYSNGCRRFFSGGALGFDTLAAKQVIQFKLSHPDCELHLILPCRNQTDRWEQRDVDMYEFILSEAKTVRYISDNYTDGCMKERNRMLVDLSDCLVAYFYREASGAGQTVRMARGAGKTVYNLISGLGK